MAVTSALLADEGQLPFDRLGFFEAFVSSLVVRDMKGVSPDQPRSRRGFGRVLAIIDDAVRLLRETDDEDSYRKLVRLRNELKPSSSGSYDGFEAALRSLQLTISSCPNPFYTEIAFTMPRSHAVERLKRLDPLGRDLASRSAEAFLKEVDA
jgi:hypothetical protein